MCVLGGLNPCEFVTITVRQANSPPLRTTGSNGKVSRRPSTSPTPGGGEAFRLVVVINVAVLKPLPFSVGFGRNPSLRVSHSRPPRGLGGGGLNRLVVDLPPRLYGSTGHPPRQRQGRTGRCPGLPPGGCPPVPWQSPIRHRDPRRAPDKDEAMNRKDLLEWLNSGASY